MDILHFAKMIEATRKLTQEKQEQAAIEFLKKLLQDLSKEAENEMTPFSNTIFLWCSYLTDAINLGTQ